MSWDLSLARTCIHVFFWDKISHMCACAHMYTHTHCTILNVVIHTWTCTLAQESTESPQSLKACHLHALDKCSLMLSPGPEAEKPQEQVWM